MFIPHVALNLDIIFLNLRICLTAILNNCNCNRVFWITFCGRLHRHSDIRSEIVLRAGLYYITYVISSCDTDILLGSRPFA